MTAIACAAVAFVSFLFGAKYGVEVERRRMGEALALEITRLNETIRKAIDDATRGGP